MIKDILKSLAKSEDSKGITIVTNTGDIFTKAVIIEYIENKKGDEIRFYNTETIPEDDCLFDDEFEDDFLYSTMNNDPGEYVYQHIWKVDNIVGVSMTTLSMSSS